MRILLATFLTKVYTDPAFWHWYFGFEENYHLSGKEEPATKENNDVTNLREVDSNTVMSQKNTPMVKSR